MTASRTWAVGSVALRSVFTINDSPARWPIALKAALTMAIPLAIGILAGREGLGLIAGLGAFTVLYGPTTAGRFRLRLMLVVAVGLLGCLGLGVVAASYPWLLVPFMVVVAVVAAVLCNTLKVGPPGSYFFVLETGIGYYLVAHAGHHGGELLLAATSGAIVAIIVGMSDLIVDPHRPERRAVQAAERAVSAFETAEHDLRAARSRASTALHHAWTTLRDATGPRAGRVPAGLVGLTAELQGIHDRHLTRLASSAGVTEGDPLHPRGVAHDTDDRVDLAAEDLGVDAEQLRETALGRPEPSYLLRSSLRWPSEVLLIALRLAVATTIAGAIASAIGSDHVYWAVAFAALVLHQGGSRVAQTTRGLQRLLGTLAGLLVFGVIIAIHPSSWGLLLVVVLLQFSVEMLVTRNYALAVVVITPLALTIATGGNFDHPMGAVVRDRAVDTLIGVAVALCVLWLTMPRSSAVRFVRAAKVRTLEGIAAVVADLAAGRVTGRDEQEHRRVLYFQLLEGEGTTGRAKADDPVRVEPYLDYARAVTQLGYLVLAAAWHPELRHDQELFSHAAQVLDSLAGSDPSGPEDAAGLAARVSALSALITQWQKEIADDDLRPDIVVDPPA
ncbi:FUSC family protein [Kribbia dieselivorans]|uniref:FUSC family protein n=1 Tax=Kribbia dieselivorans TaxID=331526 RepID=UPI0008388E96|nr:FUSC family protein [Kribbia dieselivorans]